MLRILFWVLLASTVIAFWISLRTTENEIHYTVVAVVLWVLTYAVHKMNKSKSKE